MMNANWTTALKEFITDTQTFCPQVISGHELAEGPTMPPVHVDARVRLKEELPALWLHRGQQGVVVSVWLSPGDFFYEVEFPKAGKSPAVRALLHAQQLEVVE